jgi:FHA domain
VPKFCANGHQMEDSWDLCPYCQKTGFIPGARDLKKTRIDSSASTPTAVQIPTAASLAPPPAAAPAPVVRKTMVMADLHRGLLMGWVVLMDGMDRGRDFRIREGQNSLGSDSSCNIVISHPTISGKHANLRAEDGKFFLTDLDSTNGTYLNEGPKRIAREEIKDNDLIRLGEVTLKFKCL